MNFSILLWLLISLLTLGSTSGSDDPALIASATESPPRNLVEATRTTAELAGILTDEYGCLRVTSADALESQSQVLVWQKDIFEIDRRADTLLIVDLFGRKGQPSYPVTWQLGDMIRGGGGVIGAPDDHAGAGFIERCAGPYFLVSGVQ